MRDNLRAKLSGPIWRLAIFMVVCLLGMFALFAIFAQLRFQAENDLQRRIHRRHAA